MKKININTTFEEIDFKYVDAMKKKKLKKLRDKEIIYKDGN